MSERRELRAVCSVLCAGQRATATATVAELELVHINRPVVHFKVTDSFRRCNKLPAI